MKKTGLLALLSIGIIPLSQAQNIIKSRTYPTTYFSRPMNIPPEASGSFGELRATHFHGGDDYRTQQRINIPVNAPADGFVSRVRVQIGGGGNAVYLDHPNGYTTAYLHLESFTPELNQLVRQEQYKQQRFDVDITLKPQQIKVRKGQLIAYSGNTGGSAGPHLHFEVRETKDQIPLNPQLFGLLFPDDMSPVIRGLTVYDLNNQVFDENTPRRHQQLKALGSNKYTLTGSSPVSVNGQFGLGINTVDKRKNTSFTYGVYSIELFVDNKNVSTILFEAIPFDVTRAVQSYIDYPYFKRSGVRVQKSFKDQFNPAKVYHFLQNDGKIEFKDDAVHDIKYVVKDVQGNTSELTFQVKNNPSLSVARKEAEGLKIFHFNAENKYEAENARIDMNKNVLYNDIYFKYSQSAKLANGYSQVQHIHDVYTPLFSYYKLAIKPDYTLSENLQSKALIISTSGGAVGGKYENGWVVASTREFGNFYVGVDVTAPTIVARNVSEGKNVAAQKSIDFTVRDNLSGIDSFNAYIDGQWVLMKYDPKSSRMWHDFESTLSKGSHTFTFEVKDAKDNKKVYKTTFIR